MRKIYYPEISFIRAIACLLVVLTHITLAYPITEYNSPTLFNLLINQFARVGTPIFALISGLLLFNSTKDKPLDVQRFFKSRLNKVIVPYLIWTVIYLLLGTITHTHPFKLQNILHYIFLGEGYVHLYFMIVVIQFYFLFPIVSKFINQKNISVVMILSTLLMIGWYIVRHQAPFETLYHRAFILNWIGFFFMGGFMAYHLNALKVFAKKHFGNIVIVALVAVVMMMVEMKLPALYQSDRLMNIIYVPIFTLLFLGIYHVKANIFWKDMLQYIGDRSMGIYLIHQLVIGTLGNVFTTSFWHADFMLLHFIIVVTLSLMAVEVIVRLPFGQQAIPIAKMKRDSNNPFEHTVQSAADMISDFFFAKREKKSEAVKF